MSQQLTIIFDGDDGEVLPDSVGMVLRSLFAIVNSMDERSWEVGTPRIKWRISEAKLVNPLTLTATGRPRFADQVTPDLAIDVIARLKEIERGATPRGFTTKDLNNAKEIGRAVRFSRRLTIQGLSGKNEQSIDLSQSFLRRVNRLLLQPKKILSEYGSLDGTLIQLVNDPMRLNSSAKLRERIDGFDVSCYADPKTASEMAHFLNRETRVVLYGIITTEDGVPKRIDVESFTTIPNEDELPSLEDIHAMKLRPPEGATVEEYLQQLRGDE